MSKNILLTFLSDVKCSENGIISKTHYEDIEKAVETTNESAVRYLVQKKSNPLDRLFSFVTDTVRSKNIKCGKSGRDYVDADGKVWTSLSYFRHRIVDVVLDPEETVEECEFDESGDIASTLRNSIEMAARIQDYVSRYPKEEIILNVDMTGGLRHANMLMLAVVRLLQYSGIKIGSVLYSNYSKKRVEEARDIYELFDYVAGAEEFVRFGSVDTIREYFETLRGHDDLSPEIKDLLDAMDVFAEEIQLCRRGKFERAIEGLRRSVENFAQRCDRMSGKTSGQEERRTDSVRMNDRLMQLLLARIQKDYGVLLNASENKRDKLLSIIAWCIERGYLQQAMTFYTEGVPEYLFDCGALRIGKDHNREELMRKCWKKDRERNGRDLEFFILNVFNLDKTYTESDDVYSREYREYEAFQKVLQGNLNKAQEGLFEEFRGVYEAVSRGEISVEEACCRLKLRLSQYRGVTLGNESRMRDVLQLLTMRVDRDTSLQDVLSRWKLKDAWNAVEQAYIKSSRHGNWMSKTPREKCRILGSFLQKNISKPQFIKLIGGIRPSCGTLALERLVAPGWIELAIHETDFCGMLDRYDVIKNERNHANHAKEEESSFATASLRECMLRGLEELRKASGHFEIAAHEDVDAMQKKD